MSDAVSRRAAPAVLCEVLFEFRLTGNSTRVVAIDPVSNTEVVMVGAASYGEHALKRLAARKLAYVVEKKNSLTKR